MFFADSLIFKIVSPSHRKMSVNLGIYTVINLTINFIPLGKIAKKTV